MTTNSSIPKTTAAWGILVACLGLLLATALLPPMPPAKPRPQRIQTVNHLDHLILPVPVTNAQPAPATH